VLPPYWLLVKSPEGGNNKNNAGDLDTGTPMSI
jgi:hypothetical protein